MPADMGIRRLSFTGEGINSTKVVNTAAATASVRGIPGTNNAKAIAITRKVTVPWTDFPKSEMLPHFLPTSAAVESDRESTSMAKTATSFSNIRIAINAPKKEKVAPVNFSDSSSRTIFLKITS